MIQYHVVQSFVLIAALVTLLTVGFAYLRSTVGSFPAPPSSVRNGERGHYYCLDCYADFSERAAAVSHAKGRTDHDVTLLRRNRT